MQPLAVGTKQQLFKWVCLSFLLSSNQRVQASASEIHSQPPPQSPNPAMHTNQPFVFAPHHASPLYPQPPMHHYQHTPHPWQSTPHPHSLSPTLSAEAESPAETQVYSLRSRTAPRVLAEPSGLQRTHDRLQKPEHQVHHFFTCHTKQVVPCCYLCFSDVSCPTGWL